MKPFVGFDAATLGLSMLLLQLLSLDSLVHEYTDWYGWVYMTLYESIC